MYKCHYCQTTSAPGVRLNRIPTAFRKKEYENKIVLSYGYEIIKEANACGSCAITHAAVPPTVGSDDFKNVTKTPTAEEVRNWHADE